MRKYILIITVLLTPLQATYMEKINEIETEASEIQQRTIINATHVYCSKKYDECQECYYKCKDHGCWSANLCPL
jgi:hypothetical protein